MSSQVRPESAGGAAPRGIRGARRFDCESRATLAHSARARGYLRRTTLLRAIRKSLPSGTPRRTLPGRRARSLLARERSTGGAAHGDTHGRRAWQAGRVSELDVPIALGSNSGVGPGIVLLEPERIVRRAYRSWMESVVPPRS